MSRSTKSSKSKSAADTDENVQQFCAITGASVRDARRYLTACKRLDVAINTFYNDSMSRPSGGGGGGGPSTTKLNQLFDQYKDPNGDDITVNGTIKLCEDLDVNPEDVVLLAIAYELKSASMGEWTRKGWVEGWKAIGCDNIPAMKSALVRLRDELASEPAYFRQVYNYTFEFGRAEGQRILGYEMAQGFWSLLIPHGLRGGALAHISPTDEDDDIDMGGEEEGWQDEYTEWWFEFLAEKGSKPVSKDTWQMFLEFVRTTDSLFEKHDMEAAWPSTIDDFVEYAKERLASQRR